MFLIARYREELDAGADIREALARAVGRAGPAVAASAATVICGICMLAFTRFGKIQQAGLVIPLSLILVLCAAMTLAPSALRLTGRWIFWPQRLRDAANEGRDAGPAPGFLGRLSPQLLPDVWGKIGPVLFRRPGLIWLGVVAVMTPFAVIAILHYNEVNYDPLSGLPESAERGRGQGTRETLLPGSAGAGHIPLAKRSDQVRW